MARRQARGLMGARYAIYFAPEMDSPLDVLAARWLGRDAAGSPAQPVLPPGLSRARRDALVRSPAHYGFHATLKAPFELADGRSETELLAAAAEFARSRTGFLAPPLEVAALGRFLALVPSRPSPDLDALAADCVRGFEPFRAPLSGRDLDRRRAAGLTPRQEALLDAWGYPYVLDEFRFHMTLTGPIADAGEREHLSRWLEQWFAEIRAAPLRVDAIAVHSQETREAPFILLRRFALAD